jgi:hypothetical protein
MCVFDLEKDFGEDAGKSGGAGEKFLEIVPNYGGKADIRFEIRPRYAGGGVDEPGPRRLGLKITCNGKELTDTSPKELQYISTRILLAQKTQDTFKSKSE